MSDQRAAQVAAMAQADRVQLLALLLSDPNGVATAERLAGSGAPGPVRRHLRALAEVGLVIEGPSGFRPTHDALVRFGSLAGEISVPAVPHSVEHERVLRSITTTLSIRFAGVLAPETVAAFVHESYDLLASRATIPQFLPQLTERFAADRLEAVASLDRADRRSSNDVLFVCVRNAGRSQIAAALMRDRVGTQVHIRAAGIRPASRVNPAVREELALRGLDGLTEFPRPLTTEIVRASGWVVTMGCGDACPVVPGRRYEDWAIEDPADRKPQEVRRIVDEISIRVDRLIAEMGVLPA
ncbi:low molecular weight phosphatase family protein [Nocardioides sp. NPDC057772]|uniref:arsenate-mycothiol transferase ArsC n=1 Tax=Nocardioides sp. NPDC057772 TaxID=3346245 RepID=UPI003670FFBE